MRDLWLRTGLPPRVLERLADADAFGSLGLSRRQALWAAKALGRSGDQDDLPLLRVPGAVQRETLHCRPGTQTSSETPDQRRTASRCAASGETKRKAGSDPGLFYLALWYMSAR